MKLIRYQVWKFPPSWVSVVPLGVFDFHVEALQARVQLHIRWYDDHPAVHNRAQRALWQKMHTLADELQTLPEELTPWETSDSDRIWWLVDGLVFDGSWGGVFCPGCEARWNFSDCTSEQWSVGADLAAEGGRLLKCPQGHLLCRSHEWDS